MARLSEYFEYLNGLPLAPLDTLAVRLQRDFHIDATLAKSIVSEWRAARGPKAAQC